MPEEVFVNKELGIIEKASYGVVTHEDLFCSLQRIEAFAKETGIDKVLEHALAWLNQYLQSDHRSKPSRRRSTLRLKAVRSLEPQNVFLVEGSV